MKQSVISLALAAAALSGAVCAQDVYPSRTVRLIVPFPPGGSTDIVGRVVAQKLTEAWGQQVIVDNRGGAGGQIGAELAAHSPADGYTLVVGHIGTFGVNPSLYPKLRYDAVKDFVPISLVARVPNMLAVHPSLPVKTVKQLVDLARAKPGTLNYGSSGSGSNPFLCVEYFKMLTRTDIVHVPYKGTGPMLIDLIAGQISLTINGVPPLLSHVQAKRLQPIAVASDKRLSILPALPTVIESGVPGYEVVQWYGILAPANTPRAVVDKVNADINRFLARPDTAAKMASEGAIPSGGTPEQFGALIRAEIERWAKVVKATGAKP
ncbi:MAG: transporter substrate-binding protein [Betaproteobacteria bacterium]|nr:transporter substrate-binding protein [Betaproteobacteria bacterium]